MAEYQMQHTGAELDAAIGAVLDNYRDVSPVTAVASDVAYGKVIVTAEGPVTGTFEGVVPPESWRKAASGLTVSESDGMAGWPLYSLAGRIAPYQTGSGDPAPDNVRAITGRTVQRTRCAGKNLLPKHAAATETSGDVTFTFNADGSVRVTGELGSGAETAYYAFVTWQRFLPVGVALTVSGGTPHVTVQMRYTNASGSTSTAASSANGAEGTGTIPETARASLVRLYVSAGSGEIADAVMFAVRNGYVTGETININGGMYYAP